MEGGGGYTVQYVPQADAQIGVALAWWRRHRPAAPALLARELESALDRLAVVPQIGRRVRLRGQPGARRLLLTRTEYHLYYVIADERRAVVIVYFRHARRRPLALV